MCTYFYEGMGLQVPSLLLFIFFIVLTSFVCVCFCLNTIIVDLKKNGSKQLGQTLHLHSYQVQMVPEWTSEGPTAGVPKQRFPES